MPVEFARKQNHITCFGLKWTSLREYAALILAAQICYFSVSMPQALVITTRSMWYQHS